MDKVLFTSESVTEGHPDKICDQISDAILDALLEQDPMSRVACETCTTTGIVMVMGEISTKAYVDIQKIVRDTVREIGYTRGKYGFDADTCGVITTIDEQSSDIAMGVDKALEAKENNMTDEEIDAIGAGDQGMMFGFATNETEEYMPYPISLAHKLSRQLTKVRKDGTLSYLRPDGKTQVTVEYDDGKPSRLDAVVLSTQHDPDITQEQIHEDIKREVFDKILPADMVDDETKFFINPTGRFVIGGPHGDAGLTGRKIIVDTYGGYARHGGGAFSGKDCTKVDRSAAYAARYVAKNIVAAGLADKCEIQLSYAIGVAEPTSIMVDTFGTGKKSNQDIKREVFDKILPADMVDDETKFFINPTGRFVIGGPHGDAGLTGRKIIVDTYGGYARHGGGAFSGKDCTKVDRSAAYAARYVAKNIVAAGLADKCEIQLSYAIGVAEPTSIMVDTFGTGKKSNQELVDLIRKYFDLRPAGIIKMLDLRRPIYKQTAAYGHFGRNDLDLPWERLDKVDLLKGE